MIYFQVYTFPSANQLTFTMLLVSGFLLRKDAHMVTFTILINIKLSPYYQLYSFLQQVNKPISQTKFVKQLEIVNMKKGERKNDREAHWHQLTLLQQKVQEESLIASQRYSCCTEWRNSNKHRNITGKKDLFNEVIRSYQMDRASIATSSFV